MGGNNLLIITIIAMHAWKTHFWNGKMKDKNEKQQQKPHFIIAEAEMRASFSPPTLHINSIF